MNEYNFMASDTEIYLIAIDDSGEEIIVFKNNVNLGHISFRIISDDRPHSEFYHITHLALDNCRRLGIGRACLIFHQQIFGRPISAGSDNGTTSDDGSHLTGDGLPFIKKMRAEGIVMSDEEFDYDDE